LTALVVAIAVASLPASASAITTTQAKASITDATTGMSDASSLVPRRSCDAPAPGHAACLSQFLAVRRTGAPVHPQLQQVASPNPLRRVRARSAATARAAAIAATTSPVPAPQPGGPAYLQQAYDVAALAQIAGGNQTIAIVDAYDSPTAESDLATYRSTFNLPPCTAGCFQKVNQWGSSDPRLLPSAPPDGKSGWQREIALDLDAVSAMCPNCKIELVEAFTDGIGDLSVAQYTAAHMTPTPNVITDSWGAVPASATSQQNANGEQTWLKNTATFTFPGIATVAASLDFGYLGNGQNSQCKNGYTAETCNVYPAALPGVTAAGGTSMVPANGIGTQAARGVAEVAWTDTGSGCDTTEARPSWQTFAGCNGRAYNDLSADADPATGMYVYNAADGGWEIGGGTSEASPLIAAYYALVGAGSDPSWAYSTAAAQPGIFNDPVSGSNGTCQAPITYICNATTGYDGPTGLGTISGAVLPGAPGIATPGFGDRWDSGDFSYTKNVTVASATLQGGVYPNGRNTTYFWQYGTTTSYGQTTPSGVASGTAPVAVTNTITGLSPGTTYHYRLVAMSPDPANPGQFLTQYGYDFELTTSSTGNAASGSGPGSGSGSGSGASTGSSGGSGSGGSNGGTSAPPVTSPPTSLPRLGAPSFGKLRIRALGSGSATVTEMLNTSGATASYYLAYGTTSKLTQRTSIASATKSGTVTWHLRGLRAGKVYYLQAVAANASGTRRSGTIRVKTSAVSLRKITVHGNQLLVTLRCRGSASCPVKLAVKVGNNTVASGRATVRGNHSATITLKLNRAAVARATHGHSAQATLSAISVWNRYAATVAAKFRLALG
jgi:subtilase family serine protease